MSGMLSQIEKRLDEKKKRLQAPPKPWSATLPAKDEERRPNHQPKGVKTRGAPPPGFRNGNPPRVEPPSKSEGAKVIGARVEPLLYAALDNFRKERGIKSLREALTIAAEERLGLR